MEFFCVSVIVKQQVFHVNRTNHIVGGIYKNRHPCEYIYTENDNKIYRLIITNGYDKNREYAKFTEQIYSKTDFLWKESISGSYSTANKEFFEKIDVIILLAGLYNNNKENFNDLIEASKNFDIPIVLVRPHGLEEVPESLEKEASTIVGWNANCIVDAIKNAEEIGRI